MSRCGGTDAPHAMFYVLLLKLNHMPCCTTDAKAAARPGGARATHYFPCCTYCFTFCFTYGRLLYCFTALLRPDCCTAFTALLMQAAACFVSRRTTCLASSGTSVSCSYTLCSSLRRFSLTLAETKPKSSVSCSYPLHSSLRKCLN